METTINERIEQIALVLAGNKIKFAEAIGENPTTLNQWIKKNKWSEIDKLEKIIKVYPVVKREWLYFGIGEMKGGNKPYDNQAIISTVSEPCVQCMMKQAVIDEYRNSLAKAIRDLRQAEEDINIRKKAC